MTWWEVWRTYRVLTFVRLTRGRRYAWRCAKAMVAHGFGVKGRR